MPVANHGTEQMALMAIGMLARQIESNITKLPFGSDAARDISEAVNKIRRYVANVGSSPGVEKTQVDAMQLAARQNAMRMQQMRQPQPSMAAPTGGAGGV